MVIEINKSSQQIAKPEIRVTGKRINDDGIIGDRKSYDASSLTKKVGDKAWRKIAPYVFNGPVTVEIIPDSNFPKSSYTQFDSLRRNSSTIFVGRRMSNIPPYSIQQTIGKSSETYYTTNGTDPTRTSSKLYTGSFSLSYNISGTNVVIKAKSYCLGRASEVNIIEFSISRNLNVI